MCIILLDYSAPGICKRFRSVVSARFKSDRLREKSSMQFTEFYWKNPFRETDSWTTLVKVSSLVRTNTGDPVPMRPGGFSFGSHFEVALPVNLSPVDRCPCSRYDLSRGHCIYRNESARIKLRFMVT